MYIGHDGESRELANADIDRMIAIAATLLTLAYPGIWFPPMRRNKK
jgi:hypothetical protein